MRFILITTSLLLILNGCMGAHKADNVAAKTEKGGLFGLSTASDIEASGLKAVQGESSVAIPYFRVAFYTENNPGGYKNGSGDTVTIHSKLIGVSPALLQKITDQAYATFVAQLKKKGFGVVSIKELNQSPTYHAIKETNTQHKDKALFGPDAIYVSPTGMRVSDASFMKLRELGIIMKELNTSVMDVTLYVTYLSQSTDTVAGGLIATGLSIGQTATVIPGSSIDFYGLQASKCQGYCPDMVAHVKLGQPVYDTSKVGELKDVTSAGDKAGDVALTALSWMTSGTKIHQTKHYELHVSPEKYEPVVTGVISKAGKKLLDKLR